MPGARKGTAVVEDVELPEELAHLDDLDIDAAVQMEDGGAAAVRLVAPRLHAGAGSKAAAAAAPGLATFAGRRGYAVLPSYAGHGAAPAGAGAHAGGRSAGAGAGAPSSSSELPFRLPDSFIKCAARLSGAVYDADDEDEAFIGAVTSGALRSAADVQQWAARRGGQEGSGSAASDALRSPSRGGQRSRSRASSALSDAAPTPLTPALLEAAFGKLEQESWAGASGALRTALEADAAAAVQRARLEVIAPLAAYAASLAEDAGGGTPSRKRAAPADRSGAGGAARKRSRQGSVEEGSGEGSSGSGGASASAGSAAASAAPQRPDAAALAASFFVPAARGASLLESSCSRDGAPGALPELIYAWWLVRRAEEAVLVGGRPDLEDSRMSEATRSIHGAHGSYLLRCFQSLGPSDVPSDFDSPLSVIALSATGMDPDELATLASALPVRSRKGGAASAPAESSNGETKRPSWAHTGSTRRRMENMSVTARAVLRGRLLRANLERLRALLDLVRRREKLKRAGLVALKEVVDRRTGEVRAGGGGRIAAAPTAADVFPATGAAPHAGLVAAVLERAGEGGAEGWEGRLRAMLAGAPLSGESS